MTCLCLVLATVCLAIHQAPHAVAVNGVETNLASDVGNTAALDFPLPPEGEELKGKVEGSTIYQIDKAPLAERTPLLMIHGGGGENQHLFRWDLVIDAFSQHPAFGDKYKVYLLRYNSKDLLEDTIDGSKKAIVNLFESVGRRPIVVLALSMGGNVAQIAMSDPSVDAAICVLMAMATPFHGSPLFSADWFQYSLYKSRYFPVLRVLDSVDYRIYFDLHKNYQQDLKWDDADDLIPQVGFFKSKLPWGPKGFLTLKRDSISILEQVNAEDKLNKKKIIAYAGYLVNPYVLGDAHKRWSYSLLAPYRFVSTQIRAQMGREQAALMVLNREISKVDAASQANELAQGAHVYALNDGITPVSSALFLDPQVCETHLLLHESDLYGLRPFIDVKGARVFRNIDHVTFVEGKPPHWGSKLVNDELHPEDGKRPIFDWMLDELMTLDEDKHK